MTDPVFLDAIRESRRLDFEDWQDAVMELWDADEVVDDDGDWLLYREGKLVTRMEQR